MTDEKHVYESDGDKVFIVNTVLNTRELLITVHRTESGSVTQEAQAGTIADLLNRSSK